MMSALARVDMAALAASSALRARVAELEEEVRQLRAAFAPSRPWPVAWRLTPSDRLVLDALYRRHGTVTALALHTLLGGNLKGTDITTVKMQIMHLRRRLGADAIGTEWGGGYFLTPAGRARCDAALAQAEEAA